MLRFLLSALLLVCTSALVMPVAPRAVATRSSAITMGNNAPDGPFTPIVLAGKVVLGEKFFNKIRGKGIAIHSQIISEFCDDYGVPRAMRGALIKKAKITGGDLGFLN